MINCTLIILVLSIEKLILKAMYALIVVHHLSIGDHKQKLLGRDVFLPVKHPHTEGENPLLPPPKLYTLLLFTISTDKSLK